MKTYPTFSVIINCHNGEAFLEEAICSVYSQTFQDWEIIFWDNASTDRSAAIAKNFDSKLLYFRSDKLTSLGEARAAALDVANGKWAAFLDVDDYWYPNKLRRQYDSLKDSSFVLCYSGICEIDQQGGEIRRLFPEHKSGMIFGEQLNQFEIHLVSSVIDLEFLNQNKLNFDNEITTSEEYNLFMKVCSVGEVCVINEVLAAYRIHSDSLSVRNIANWAVDRDKTLDDLEKLDSTLPKKFQRQWLEARCRSEYYRARAHHHAGEWFHAVLCMFRAKKGGMKYTLLLAFLFVPFAWRMVHRDAIRRRLLSSSWIRNLM